MADSGSISAGLEGSQTEIRLRSYQTEMVDHSLEGNSIVVLDTGSGKTFIAIARTAIELETCNPTKLVWFLVPSVALGHQQSRVFQQHLPAYQLRFLSGEDNVETWSDQSTWDAILANIRIVVSTHQVLYDALAHGFVHLERIALLIYDEAHHCRGRHPANAILQDFFHVLQDQSKAPKILGLSASPVMRANPHDLQSIEQNLNAIAVTPRIHRTELLRHVNRPELQHIIYPDPPYSEKLSGGFLEGLISTFKNLDINEDPYVISLRRAADEDLANMDRLGKAFMTRKTYCQESIKTLVTRAIHIDEELGHWACEWYIHECFLRYIDAFTATEQLRTFDDWSVDEKEYLHNICQSIATSVAFPSISIDSENALSKKLATLVNTLLEESSSDLTGLIFVEQRATAVALSQFLSAHPLTRDVFKVAPFVGMSVNGQRKMRLSDLAETRIQQNYLQEFHSGQKNLIVSTSALEEGIDMSSCNIVICFEQPKNLISFIQRRGRARQQSSKYIIMTAESTGHAHRGWETVEEELKQSYLDDQRQYRIALELEEQDDDGDFKFHVASTGALLTFHNAIPHLNHFCAVVKGGQYVDPRPVYSFREEDNMISAQVTMPIFVDAAFRTARSSTTWRSEKNASKDAAFHVVLKLLEAGLLNDHLLPRSQTEDQLAPLTHIDSIVSVKRTVDIWNDIVDKRSQEPTFETVWHRYILTYSEDSRSEESLEILLPEEVPVTQMSLYWNQSTSFHLKATYVGEVDLTEEELLSYQRSSETILSSIFGTRMLKHKADYLTLVGPIGSMSAAQRASWSSENSGAKLSWELYEQGISSPTSTSSIVREAERPSTPWIFQGFARNSEGELVCRATRFPKRRDFLLPLPHGDGETVPSYTSIVELPAESCIIDNLPAPFAIFAAFLPTILFKYEISILAKVLRTTYLPDLEFRDPSLFTTAITAPAAHDQVSYENLEFLGDCILKFCTTLSLAARFLEWPEAYLTWEKGRVVSNAFLTTAALNLGLERYVVYAALASAKWRPKYASDYPVRDSGGMKDVSSKTIADVVEAIIGASYVDANGDLSRPQLAIRTLLPSETWLSCSEAVAQLYDNAPHNDTFASFTSKASQMIGYTFNKPLLLQEATTHPSYVPPAHLHALELSYQRLEFIGDAVLDLIVVQNLFPLAPKLGHAKLHTLRTATVNAHILAFLCMELSAEEERYNIVPSADGKSTEPSATPEILRTALWKFMRHGSSKIVLAQRRAIQKHDDLRESISRALQSGSRYPWALLEQCDAPKFFSDIVEAVIGAIYIDSHGSLEFCAQFLEKLGTMNVLRRLVTDEVDALHPKERIGIVAVGETAKYMREEDGSVRVAIGESFVGPTVKGLGRAAAETTAATEALKVLGVYSSLEGVSVG